MTRHSGISHRPSAGGRARDAGGFIMSRSGNELSRGPFRKLRMRLAKKGMGRPQKPTTLQ